MAYAPNENDYNLGLELATLEPSSYYSCLILLGRLHVVRQMKIGELAKLAGCDVVTVRFYEGAGLLPAPARTGNNYRSYSLPHLETLHFIRQCRLLDIPLLDIQRLLQLRGSPQESCADINGLLDAQIARVTTRIEQLKMLEVEMNNLRRRCGSGVVRKDCAILAGLSNPDDASWKDTLHA